VQHFAELHWDKWRELYSMWLSTTQKKRGRDVESDEWNSYLLLWLVAIFLLSLFRRFWFLNWCVAGFIIAVR